jgi:hypothetical protein
MGVKPLFVVVGDQVAKKRNTYLKHIKTTLLPKG